MYAYSATLLPLSYNEPMEVQSFDWKQDCTDVSDGKEASVVPEHEPHNLATDIVNAKEPPWGPLCPVASTEF